METQSAEQPISLYHRALGWNLDFSLFDVVNSGAVELRWFPNGVYLADNVTKNPGRRALVIEPDWAATRDLIPQATMRGLEAHTVARFGTMSIIELTPPNGYCRWCANRLPLWPTGPSGPETSIQ